eukprot:scaffold40062_cov67-Phaeocystis_antarctica.AAC.6
MVLIESVGFGVRERDLFLYFWDLRDGRRMIVRTRARSASATGGGRARRRTARPKPRPVPKPRPNRPRQALVSPHFENTQLRRKLTLGFRAEGAGAERQLCACGDDAGTFIIPDGVSKVDLSTVVFREDGMHHGKPCFRAAPAPPAVVAAPHWTVWLARPAVNAGLCIALGFAVGVAASRRRA